ncbi:cytochrome C [Campylobacter sp. RM9344]|uniref:Cytochrome C n=1 Tax=Campylobacter californiensis TaxID=1032243 RepID=A0AAW3ZXM9_9BACT|nr:MULTISPECIES: cytochrome C [unclassified Campylobacter]MBE2985292.1 cytochrome C [Campylobacter sp. RM6883]MBE2987130.1 cytochrome C [Campylobacter sp. RM12919]MBE2988808.1 cytochrome C [Campylobacter sp. RM12920]MBE2995933.1 cytochrome C [Campylobacter sp. RM6913]MBE3022890.1 cytochrome C [Campylobacter sp. 7477a]MBE3030046.1 cytochrome C [Campylobacter sp. RM9344]
MKKLFLLSMFSCLLFGANEMYSDKVKPVFTDATSNASVGRLLPTNGVEILSKQNGRVKIKMQGYINPVAPNVVYFSDSERVIAIAFAKTAKFDSKLVKKGQNGKWDKVEVEAYTIDGDFYNEVDTMFARAKQTYADSCGICHGLHETTHYKANQWPNLFKSMLSRTTVEKDDEWLIVQYLQKHSSDVKIK